MSKINDAELVRKFSSLSASASSRGIHFDLSLKRVKQLLTAKTCYFTGLPFADSGNDVNLYRSIDRVDSDLGYTDDNTVACLTIVNRCKANLSYREFHLICKGMEKHFKRKKVDMKKQLKKPLRYGRQRVLVNN